jgi:glycosyltransferase involved in cell wall biosynthesis
MAFPDIRFHIAGKKMPSQFYNFASQNVVVHGEVPSSVDFINSYSVLLSPMISGSGVRIKIIEAMAMGKVVLATSVSAEGSGAVDDRDLLIANDKDSFIRQIHRLKTEAGLMNRLSQNAREFALEHFQNKKVIARSDRTLYINMSIVLQNHILVFPPAYVAFLCDIPDHFAMAG